MNRYFRASTALSCFAFAVLLMAATSERAAGSVVFFDDFDGGLSTQSGVTAAYSGITTTESVQGYAGIGPSGNTFGGNFLRNTTGGVPTGTAGSLTTITLTGLPAHNFVDLDFLLATIDTWDGTDGNVGATPDYFNVVVDGNEVFEASFAQQSGSSAAAYQPPPGGLLSTANNFNPAVRDGAYDMGLENDLIGIPHAGSTLVVSFFADGAGWQAGQQGFGSLLDSDESWAIDNLRISVSAVPEPSSFLFLGLVAGGVFAYRRCSLSISRHFW